MTPRSYRLTTTSRSADMGAMQETVVITADDDEAVELARTYVEAVGAEALFSATLADASGTVVWRQGSQDRGGGEPGGSPRNGGSA